MKAETLQLLYFTTSAVLGLLLIATIYYCFQLRRRLKQLDSEAWRQNLDQLYQAVEKARTGLKNECKNARELINELDSLTKRAETADRELSDGIDQASLAVKRGNRLVEQLDNMERDIADRMYPVERDDDKAPASNGHPTSELVDTQTVAGNASLSLISTRGTRRGSSSDVPNVHPTNAHHAR